MLKRLLTGFLAALAVGSAPRAETVNSGHVVLELAAETQGVAPGHAVQVALSQKIRKGWHTYWRNSGDSGDPTQIKWTLPAGWSAGAITWPTPRRLPVGPLMNYGYEDQALLPVAIKAPASAKAGQTVTLQAAVDILVCADICVPESAALHLSLPVTAGAAPPDPKWASAIAATLFQAPKPAGLAATFARTGTGVALAVTGKPLAGANVAGAYFFPYDGAVIDHAKPQPIQRGPQGLTLTLAPGYAFTKGPAPTRLEGVLALGDKAYEISATPGAAPAGASGLGAPPAASLSSGDASSGGAATGAGAAGLGLPLAAAFAFLGGLVLNLMPCVFPVLAMKAASFAGHGAERAAARRQGLAFGLGCVVTFMILAGLLIGLRAAGAAIGWGFQLQSPPVVAGLALLILAVALNLSGVFEVGSSLQGAGAGLASRRGLAGAFFTGTLAVVVAAPCTAPFMAPALGWALTQPAVAALAVFLALSLGFAAPFTAVAFIPGLLSRLPRPGPWMEGLRKALAFPMYAAAGWLVWVLTLQAGSGALARILAAGVVLAAAAWLAGVIQRRMAMGQGVAVPAAIGGLLAAAALAVALVPAYAMAPAPGEAAAGSSELAAEAYSPARLAALRAEGRPVFVNYTAAWCVSCQVNDKVALSTPATAKLFADHKVVYLKADWTRKDAAIAADLAHYGRAGVPLYLVYGVDGGDAMVLPPLLTQGVVAHAIETATKS